MLTLPKLQQIAIMIVVQLWNILLLMLISAIPSLTEFQVESCLRRIKKTSPGIDNIPAWVFRACSFELANIDTHIFNCSFSTGVIPSSWRTAIVTPIPKVSKPAAFADYRPISVMPLLSRLAERIVVTDWLRPALSPSLFVICFLTSTPSNLPVVVPQLWFISLIMLV